MNTISMVLRQKSLMELKDVMIKKRRIEFILILLFINAQMIHKLKKT